MKRAAFLRRTRKTDLDWGAWKTGRPMPKSALKLRRPYPVSAGWTWRLVRFRVDGDSQTVLLKHLRERQDFMAMPVREADGEPGPLHCGRSPAFVASRSPAAQSPPRPGTGRRLDYVITHELCHMAEPHRGAAFFEFRDKVMPDWEHRKQRLERAMA